MIAAVELKGYDEKERIGLKIYEYALKNGVLIRPLGSVVYFMPPYIITPEELKKVFTVTRDAIKTILRDS
ncbi:MAG: adenosylmethionine---8-amino-7-oxononanoate aminotransferase [Campylobacterota bacterium]|nr:adenosylmethionine---8-amino-7-oxononanoate aminotransferase [Campylobacterota bacterium]